MSNSNKHTICLTCIYVKLTKLTLNQIKLNSVLPPVI